MIIRVAQAIIGVAWGVYFCVMIRVNLLLITEELAPLFAWVGLGFSAVGLLLVVIAIGYWIVFEIQRIARK